MQEYIIGNLILIFCAGGLGFFFGPTSGRGFTAAFAAWFAFCLSVFGWIAFVAIHFIGMYW